VAVPRCPSSTTTYWSFRVVQLKFGSARASTLALSASDRAEWGSYPNTENLGKALRNTRRNLTALIGSALAVAASAVPSSAASVTQTTKAPSCHNRPGPPPGEFRKYAYNDCQGREAGGDPPGGYCHHFPPDMTSQSAWNNSSVPVTFWEASLCGGRSITVPPGAIVGNFGFNAVSQS
jgi:hypothetical protein